MGLLLLLQPQGWPPWPPHPTEPSSAELEWALASVLRAPWRRPPHGVEPGEPATLDSRSISDDWRACYVFMPFACLLCMLLCIWVWWAQIRACCWGFLGLLPVDFISLHHSEVKSTPHQTPFSSEFLNLTLFRGRHSCLLRTVLCASQRIGTFNYRNVSNPLHSPARKR